VLIKSNDSEKPELLRLTGGNKTSKPSWVHSDYQLDESKDIIRGVVELIKLGQDKRFGLNVRETQPLKLENVLVKESAVEKMEIE
jgi:metalloprotease ARX1